MTIIEGILGRIVEAKAGRIAEAKRLVSLAEVRAAAEQTRPGISFARALESGDGVSVISEMKRASPSAGDLDPELDPADRARAYCDAGASAISVLTEQDFFQGGIGDLRAASRVACDLGVAVLEKDFVFDEYQVYEAKASGADAVLLIVAILEQSQYLGLLDLVRSLELGALVEVFDAEELDVALYGNPEIVGVNNRNLKTLETSLDVFEQLAPSIPADSMKVAESGMKTVADVHRMGAAGADAVLVGESLMRAGGGAGELVRAMSRSNG